MRAITVVSFGIGVLLVGAACGAHTPPAAPAPRPDLPRGTTWADYLGTGQSCTLTSVSRPSLGPGQSEVLTMRFSVTARTQEPDGVHVAEHETLTAELSDGAPSTASLDRSIVNAKDGTIHFDAASASATLKTIGITASGAGEIVVPSVAELRAGRTHTTRYTITLGAATAQGDALFEQITTDGADSVVFSVAPTIAPLPITSLTLPSGTFTDVVGYRETAVVTPPADYDSSSPVGSQLLAVLRGESSDVVYARGVGIVQETEHLPAGDDVLQLSSCSG